MAKGVKRFPSGPADMPMPKSVSTHESHSRLILCVGRQRYAFDFDVRISELGPAGKVDPPDKVVSIDRARNRATRKQAQ